MPSDLMQMPIAFLEQRGCQIAAPIQHEPVLSHPTGSRRPEKSVNPISLLIVASPGPLRESLRALLLTLPRIRVMEMEDPVLALEVAGACRPALLLVDLDKCAESFWRQLETSTGDHHSTRYIFLADSVEQQLSSRAAAAGLVVLKGFPASRLLDLVNEVMSGLEGTSTLRS